ncbi:MAG: HAD family phosphatase [Theionarchaea archaeon]|nr:HAD family phosphatase [Theionarchaea archaeon]MBU7019467.1 HAD family phosphatase [Theionarchaea archaeon]MBU7035409.1 HAD family phosphatase [Theionarchaea archaeon]MBU7041232.1 HAD family phosphatase [Theionarchaea archaeon]
MKLAFFDMDGVLTPTAHALHFAEMVGREPQLKKVFTGTTNRKIGLEWVIRKGASLFCDMPESTLREAGETLPLVKGAEKTIEALKEAEYQPIIITNGVLQIASAFAERLGITECYGNVLEIREGKITGAFVSETLITLQSKGDLVRKIVAQKSSRKESVAVGNDENDWAMFQEVGFSILFNPSSNLTQRLKQCLEEAEKGFKKEFIEFCKSVDVIIERPDFELLLPFLIPEPTVFPDKVRIEKTRFV